MSIRITAFPRSRHGRQAAPGDLHRMTQPLEHPDDHDLAGRIVLGHQDAPRTASGHGRRNWRLDRRHGFRQANAEVEATSLAFTTFHHDLAAHLGHQPLANGKAEAAAAKAPGNRPIHL